MIVRDENKEFVGLSCDTCGRAAPPTREIKEAFGLNQMGWHCSGGTHICPTCFKIAAHQPGNPAIN